MGTQLDDDAHKQHKTRLLSAVMNAHKQDWCLVDQCTHKQD
jgi:hypothetical protein